MASIRLFGRGKNAVAAGGAAVGAALIADVLESLTAASMSTTWRCRHAGGVSIGEGAVDFASRRSRATVIRGKYAFEYVRSGADVYRTTVPDVDPDADGGARARAVAADARVGGVDAEVEADAQSEPELESESEDALEGFDELADEQAAEALESLDAEVDDGDEEDVDGGDDEGGDSVEPESVAAGAGAGGAAQWERFSDHDACGVHAYAEPAVLAAGVRAAGVVQARGAQEVDGVMLSAYAVTVKPKPGDPNRVLARLARQLRDHGANMLVVTAFADESQATASDDNGDSDGDGGGDGPRIVRLRIELPHWTPADDPTADHAVSVDLFEFDEPVSIDVPGDAARRRARSCADLALF